MACGADGWPADLNSSGLSANAITIQDFTSFVAPVRHINTSPGDYGYNVRWDLVPNTTLFAEHINLEDLIEIIVLRPPMLGGAPVMNKTCPGTP
jgi:hypothetical protein